MKEQNEPQHYAAIMVKDPVYQENQRKNLPGYVTFSIVGKDPHGEFQIRRKHKDFVLLRQLLVERFIGLYVPPIHSKKIIEDNSQTYIEERRRFLNYFCLKISQRPYLFDSDIFQTFIRGDYDFQRAYKQITKTQFALITNVYEIEFKKESEGLSSPQILIKNQLDYDFLKKIQKRLEQIRSELQDVAQAKTQYVNQFNRCFCQIMPKFETDFVMIHSNDPKNMLFKGNKDFTQKSADYDKFIEVNPLHDYVEMISYDIRQTRALIEAIDSRKSAQSKKQGLEKVRRQYKEQLEKLKGGKTTLKSLFTSGNKEKQIKQIQSFISTSENSEQCLSKCIPLANVGIHRQIENYKKTRSLDYIATFQEVVKRQMKSLLLYGLVLKSPLQKLDQ